MATLVAGFFLAQALPASLVVPENIDTHAGESAATGSSAGVYAPHAAAPCDDGEACTGDPLPCVPAAGCLTFSFLPVELEPLGGLAAESRARGDPSDVEPAPANNELPTPPPRA